MIESMQLGAFHFLRPWWLLLLLPIIGACFYALQQRKAMPDWGNLIAAHLLAALTVGNNSQRWFNPLNLGLFILSLSVLLMAGPTWQRQASPFVQDNAVLVVALDLSKSMDQTDIQPSRIERAKQKVADLLELRGSARTGLVVYSGTAHQVIPLTNDPEIIRQYLSAVDSNMMPKSGKFPEHVIPLVDQMLREAAAPGTLLIIGDGVGPNTVQEFSQYFAQAPYQLLVMGMGLTEIGQSTESSGASNALFGGAHLPLQERALRRLASQSGGRYLASSFDKSDVRSINRLVDRHLELVDDSNRPWVDAGYYLLYPIAFFFLLWFRRGWTLNWCIALFFVHALSESSNTYANEIDAKAQIEEQQAVAPKTSSPSPLDSLLNRVKHGFMDLWLSRDQQGRYYFEHGDYASAAQRFESPSWQAMAFYYAENFAAAAELFRQIDSPTGRFNLANALAQGQHYVNAVKIYSLVLEQQQDHSGALKNKKIVQRIIDDINRMSASQQAEPGKSSRDLGDAPQRAEGAAQLDISSDEVEQFTAEQILLDEQIQEMWMRQVQADPARFLSAKFNLQHHRQTMLDAAESIDSND